MNTIIKHIIRFYLVGIILGVVNSSVYAQISYGGKPLSYTERLSDKDVIVEQMPEFDIDAIKKQHEADQKEKIGPVRFGHNIGVDISLMNNGSWKELKNGDRIWRVGIKSKGAFTINLIFEDFFLPKGAGLFIYNKKRMEHLGGFTSGNNRKDRRFATDLINAETIYLEYFEPANVKGEGSFTIKNVTHGYRDFKTILKSFGTSLSCQNNVICPEGDPWTDEVSSVALILVGGNGFCSGAMINNTGKNGIPYLLTAKHCLSGNESNWVFRFNY
ncbi:MAG: lysyl endopeptidase, partial [Bacteroidetes bacterium]|nr:lysyl endopeptidase [Bacteroidota bacterium]